MASPPGDRNPPRLIRIQNLNMAHKWRAMATSQKLYEVAPQVRTLSKPVTISSRERTYFVASGMHLKVATPTS
jgi:hypothetical protein